MIHRLSMIHISMVWVVRLLLEFIGICGSILEPRFILAILNSTWCSHLAFIFSYLEFDLDGAIVVLPLRLFFLAPILGSALPTAEEPALRLTEEEPEAFLPLLLLTPQINSKKGGEEADLEEEVEQDSQTSENGERTESRKGTQPTQHKGHCICQ